MWDAVTTWVDTCLIDDEPEWLCVFSKGADCGMDDSRLVHIQTESATHLNRHWGLPRWEKINRVFCICFRRTIRNEFHGDFNPL
jgi:hypothetical protein